MKSVVNYLTAMFMVMYWIFRVVVTYMYTTGREFLATPINLTSEIAILFITLVCIILVVNRKMLGGIIYAVAYVGYFGTDLFLTLKPMLDGQELDISAGTNILFSALAVILAIVALIDVASSQIKPTEKKETDWFYGNKDFDILHDSRDDRNNYKY